MYSLILRFLDVKHIPCDTATDPVRHFYHSPGDTIDTILREAFWCCDFPPTAHDTRSQWEYSEQTLAKDKKQEYDKKKHIFGPTFVRDR